MTKICEIGVNIWKYFKGISYDARSHVRKMFVNIVLLYYNTFRRHRSVFYCISEENTRVALY